MTYCNKKNSQFEADPELDEGEDITLEYVQKLEDEIAEKDKEIKFIKDKITKGIRQNSCVL